MSCGRSSMDDYEYYDNQKSCNHTFINYKTLPHHIVVHTGLKCSECGLLKNLKEVKNEGLLRKKKTR